MKLRNLLIIGIMISTILLSGCENAYQSCMRDCKVHEVYINSECNKISGTISDALQSMSDCDNAIQSRCFEECK